MALQLTIVTPQGEAFSGEVERVELPGSEGEFGVLAGHERFLTPLAIGELELHEAKGVEYAAISEGFADVSGEQATVMVGTCEMADEIDVARAERAKRHAEEEIARLEREKAEEHSYKLQEAALQRAIIRIQVAGKRG